jgi:hypothetical protein
LHADPTRPGHDHLADEIDVGVVGGGRRRREAVAGTPVRPTTADDGRRRATTGDDEESAAACGQACPRSAAGAPSERGSDAPIMHIMSTNSARDRFPGWFLTR